MNRLIPAAVAALLGATGVAHAQATITNQAITLDLGTSTGVAYYTPEAGGYHVVVTLAGASREITRFEAVLGAEQSMIVSLPGPIDGSGRRVALTHSGDRLVVTRNSVSPGS